MCIKLKPLLALSLSVHRIFSDFFSLWFLNAQMLSELCILSYNERLNVYRWPKALKPIKLFTILCIRFRICFSSILESLLCFVHNSRDAMFITRNWRISFCLVSFGVCCFQSSLFVFFFVKKLFVWVALHFSN